jgi:hypothetical protein
VQGPWSDKSEEIQQHPEFLRRAGMEDKDDGIFLISIEDVARLGEGPLEGVDCFEEKQAWHHFSFFICSWSARVKCQFRFDLGVKQKFRVSSDLFG